MLSILIPTYNYSAFSLAKELCYQTVEAGIPFEIIVIDDCSNDENLLDENSKINELTHCTFERNSINLGRAKTRNLLAKKAKYDWLLFMDGDTFPQNKTFIANYLKAITEDQNKVFFGGIAYQKSEPETSHLLRWKYGSKREEITVFNRSQNPYLTTLTSNILIKKEVFDWVQFDERIAEYGYEDLVFTQDLKANTIVISHIDNAAFHLNYETSDVFLSKTKKALETLKFIEEQHFLNSVETKIQKAYRFIRTMKLDAGMAFLFKKLQLRAEKNLFSNNPSLFIFDLYKLGYFCFIKTR